MRTIQALRKLLTGGSLVVLAGALVVAGPALAQIKVFDIVVCGHNVPPWFGYVSAGRGIAVAMGHSKNGQYLSKPSRS